MPATQTTADPMIGGFYTAREAARFLGIDNQRRIHRWLQGAGADAPAVIQRDYAPMNRAQELSFWDLIEVRFVEHFRAQGLSLQYLRRVAEQARAELQTRHPFALSNAEYLTDRKRIFASVAKDESRSVREMLTGQYEMYEAIETVLAKGISFDPKTHLAEEFRPLEEICPNVTMNPAYAYGHPTVGAKRVPTAALLRQVQAEQGDRAKVADWWMVDRADVDEAVEFEIRMAA